MESNYNTLSINERINTKSWFDRDCHKIIIKQVIKKGIIHCVSGYSQPKQK